MAVPDLKVPYHLVEIQMKHSLAGQCGTDKHHADWYGHVVAMALFHQKDPTSVTEARAAPDKLQWEEAMDAEMISLQSNAVWQLVDPQPNRKVFSSKRIFKHKVNADGVVEQYEVRLVAQGCA